jgi:hypothetical protein
MTQAGACSEHDERSVAIGCCDDQSFDRFDGERFDLRVLDLRQLDTDARRRRDQPIRDRGTKDRGDVAEDDLHSSGRELIALERTGESALGCAGSSSLALA